LFVLQLLWSPRCFRQHAEMVKEPLRCSYGVRHGYLRHLAAVIEPQPEVSKMTIDAGVKPEGGQSAPR
jgi:hypothetical protein